MARKPAIQMTNGIDDIIKGGKKLLYRAADAMPKSKTWMMPNGDELPKRKAQKLLKQDKLRMLEKYGKQLPADKGAQRAIKYAEIDAILKKKTKKPTIRKK